MESLAEFLKRYSIFYCYGMGKCLHDFKIYCKKKKLRFNLQGYMVSDASSISLSRTGRKAYTYSTEMVTSETGIIITLYRPQYIREVLDIIGKDRMDHVFVLLEDTSYASWHRKRYLGEGKRRRNYSIFDYSRLANNIDYGFLPEKRQWNSVSYGIFRCVEKYVKVPFYDVGKCSIIHGINVTSNKIFSPVDLYPPDENMFTSSSYTREDFGSNLNVHVMKPYILYAKSLYSYGKLSRLKKKLGKTLLVMPPHSVLGVDLEYDRKRFIQEVERVRLHYGYQTVLLCFHFVDVQKKEFIHYRGMDYKIVTAGHVCDVNFLSRLRTIMLLSDVIMASDVGTYLWYAIALSRPVYIFSQEIKHLNLREDHEKYMEKKMDDEAYEKMISEIGKDHTEIVSRFSAYGEKITEEQYEVLRKHCSTLRRTVIRPLKQWH